MVVVAWLRFWNNCINRFTTLETYLNLSNLTRWGHHHFLSHRWHQWAQPERSARHGLVTRTLPARDTLEALEFISAGTRGLEFNCQPVWQHCGGRAGQHHSLVTQCQRAGIN